MLIYQKVIIPKWVIEGHPLYFFAEDKKLYNFNTGKQIKMQLKGYTRGFYLNGRFYSLQQLKPKIKPYINAQPPF